MTDPGAAGRAAGGREEPAGLPESGAALFTFDASQRIRSWNRAAEDLTGAPAEAAVGSPCWSVLCGKDEAGRPICHTGCPHHRMLRANWPVPPTPMMIATRGGRRRVVVAMVSLRGSGLFAGVILRPEPEVVTNGAPAHDAIAALTPRQRTVLTMLAQGRQAKVIAAELHLSEMTVRNHIRGILRALDCTSQLAAVAEARRLGLLEGTRETP